MQLPVTNGVSRIHVSIHYQLLQVMRDRGFERDMKNLEVHCYHCDWEGHFEHYAVNISSIHHHRFVILIEDSPD